MIVPSTPLALAFADIIRGICAIIGHHAQRAGSMAPQLGFVHYFLFRTVYRLDQLVKRWRAGTLPKPRPSRAGKTRAARPRLALPGRRGWLIHHAQPTAQYRMQVEMFLADPELQALVAAAPQAGRLFRPLCRLLLIDLPEYLRPPARPPRLRPPRPPAPKRPRRDTLNTPELRIPANIRAAARAWRKYDL